MRSSKSGLLGASAAVALGVFGLASCNQAPEVAIDADDLGGVVTGANGPEAGVWVIAETTDLPTKYAKIVVTDDQGRYVIPDLPAANYTVWVRGYGLVDSQKVQARPGGNLDLTAVAAPDEKAAAHYYPALYWWAILKVPAANEFPGTGDEGNGIAPAVLTQAHWIRALKTEACYSCHQLGNEATRLLPEGLGEFDTTIDAWTRRIQSGQASTNMVNNAGNLGAQRLLKEFADWTDRIKGGELPSAKPDRPQGQERNVVITMWDWADEKTYLHDSIATDRRDPTLNANGPIFGSPELSSDFLPVLDPMTHTTSSIKVPVRDPNTRNSKDLPIFAPSPYFGDEAIWDSQTDVHNPMYDERSRMWVTARIRNMDNPAWCKAGSDHPSAKMFPLNQSPRHLAVYDKTTQEWSTIDTCFGTHHLVFGYGPTNPLWLSTGFPVGGPVLAWLDTKMFDETKDEKLSQHWTPFILDTNGNGKRDEGYVEPADAVDPTKDKRINAYPYGIGQSADGAVWGNSLGMPGLITRTVLGDNPEVTALSEVFELPYETTGAHSPRGMDVDRDGVVWASLQSGHLASFDRRKCMGPLNGPTATGKHCPEGWTLYPLPGPQFAGVEGTGNAEAPYYAWVDHFNTSGLGDNTPFITGNASDSLMALKDGQFVNFRVPYPMGFFAKNADGRIDDPNGGWKGRGVWSTFGNRTPFHMETGKGTKPKAVKFQLRPDPLAH